MENIKILHLNEVKSDKLTDNEFRHIYEIDLNKTKNYFITLTVKNDCEFNLRLYDQNKNIIKLKHDDEIENSFLADINKSIESYNEEMMKEHDDYEALEEDEEDDQYEDVEDDEDGIPEELQPLIKSDDILNNMIQDILSSLNPKDKNNKLEITIEIDDNNMPSENDMEKFIEDNMASKEIKINFNNKIYFRPKVSGKIYLSVTSDYNNQIGEYTLLVQEVEDLKSLFDKQIKVNEYVNFKCKEKFKSKKFNINLNKNKEYQLESDEGLKFLISKNKQKIISKENQFKFFANYSGKYEVEVMSVKKNVNGKFKIKCNALDKVNINNNVLYNNLLDDVDNFDHKFNFDILNNKNVVKKEDIVKGKKVILIDEYNDEFELYIKDGNLEIKPLKK